MLERMRENQKRAHEDRKTIPQFKVGDLILLKKYTQEKLDLKWEPNYRIMVCQQPGLLSLNTQKWQNQEV